MAGVGVFTAQHMAVHAQPQADAGAPGHVGAMVQALQRAPAPLGLQRRNAVIANTHIGKGCAQRCFEQSAAPVVGQAAGRAGQAAADVGRSQFNQALAQHKRPARRHADSRNLRWQQTRGRAALAYHAHQLQAECIRVAFFGGGLGEAAKQAARVGHAHRYFGAAHVHTGHGRSASRQAQGGNGQCLRRGHSCLPAGRCRLHRGSRQTALPQFPQAQPSG